MKTNSILLFIILCILSIGAGIHDHHVGITEIRYSTDSESYQISLKLFTEDLENAVLKDSGVDLDLGSEKENADSVIFKYLEKEFSIESAEGEKLNLTRIGRETDLNITWVYFESEIMKSLDALKVHNSIFMELHDEQTHVVNVDQDGKTKSTLLHSSKNEDLLKL